MATVVFTDVVDSTAHRTRVGESKADAIFRSHEDLLRRIVADHGGRVLKSVGDGVMAVFGAASDAVVAATAVHAAAARATPELALRVGVAAGDVSWDEDDCFGLPVVIAKRLEAAAEPGQVLLSEAVRLMAGDRADVTYRALEPVDLKGVDGAVAVYEAEAAVSEDIAREVPFPSALPRSASPFVGREEEVELLRRSWLRARDGGHEVVLVSGEAGAGKTRLSAEAARQFHAEGAVVLAGLNDSELSLPYQPWLMAVDQVAATLLEGGDPEVAEDLGTLAALDPRLGRHGGALPRPEWLDPETQRHRVQQAIAAVLSATSVVGPVVLVIDDLHWAGAQTLDALRSIARTNPVPRVLIVVTFRDTASEVDNPLGSALADLGRLEHVTRIELGGLDPEDVEKLVDLDQVTESKSVAELAADIRERTGGNAFFVTELCRHLHDADQSTTPTSIREVVAERLQQLSGDARRLAAILAVASTRVDYRVLRDASALTGSALTDAVGELIRSGLVEELDAGIPAYRFSHRLLADTVATLSSGAERMDLHLALADAIESVFESDRRSVLPELARHFAAAAPIGGRDKAVYYGDRAATQARRTAAYDEAVAVLRAVLDSVSDGGVDRLELEVSLVDLLQRSGHHLEAASLARDVYERATDAGEHRIRASVVLEAERIAGMMGGAAAGTDTMLQAVLDDLPIDDPALIVRLKGALGRARLFSGDPGAVAFIDQTLAEARSIGDDRALCRVLEAAIFIDRDPDQSYAVADELLDLTARLSDPWPQMWAKSNQLRHLLRKGDLQALRATLGEHTAIADHNRFFIFQFMARIVAGILALAEGRFDDADAAAEAAEALGFGEDDVTESGVYGLLMFSIRREQGRLEEMRPVLKMIARSSAHPGVWTPGMVLAMAELGMEGEARAEFRSFMSDELAELSNDSVVPATLTFLAEAAVLLDETSAALPLLLRLDRYAGTTMVVGFTTCFGPADRLRAALSELAGRPEDADAQIAAALAFARNAGSIPWEARVEHTHAWIHLRRGDDRAARRHLDRAIELAAPIGMESVLQPPPVTGRSSGGAGGSREREQPAGLSSREIDVLRLVAAGCSNRQIADELLISANTAANHVRSILQKTGCANRAEAAAYAIRNAIEPL